jgi:lysophospholipase L1-like esterase
MRRWRWWLTFVVVQAIATFVLVELALQIYNPIPFRVRGDRIVLPVHAKYEFHHAGPGLDPVVQYRKNSLGFRGPEPPRDLRTRLSLLTVGGSTTESMYLADGKTWSDVLAARLAPVFPKMWVNNAGLDGHSTVGHFVLLQQVLVPLKPNVAVFLVGINDLGVAENDLFDRKLMPKNHAIRRVTASAVAHIEIFGLAQNFWRAWRARAQGLGHTDRPLPAWPRLVQDEATIAAKLREFEPRLAPYAGRLEEIVETSRRAGIEPVLVTQPVLFGEGLDPATGIDLATLDIHGHGSGALLWRMLEAINDVTRRVAKNREVLLVDLARELPKDSRLYYDLMHFSNAGARRVGETLWAHLEPYLRTRFPNRVGRAG